jgi:hypothetical protein
MHGSSITLDRYVVVDRRDDASGADKAFYRHI